MTSQPGTDVPAHPGALLRKRLGSLTSQQQRLPGCWGCRARRSTRSSPKSSASRPGLR